MKKLTKIKLVNWHLFTNETVHINNNTLVSGENGSGKSTLLDALQYLLVGGKSGVKFNIAATDEARRSLEGYVRGRIGAENKEYLRPGDVITHVGLEFYDEESQTSSVIGCVLELPKNGHLKERFYLLENTNIHDALYLDKRLPRDYKSMKQYLKTFDTDLEPFNTQKEYRDALAKYFGIDAKKYAKILPKALAFRSIDLQSFVFEFLLDDEPIDIKGLKNNVTQLRRIESQIRLDKEKLEKLDKINKLGESLNQNLEQIKVNEIIEKMSFIEKREAFLQSSENLLDKVNTKYEILKSDKEALDEIIESNDQEIIQLESARNNDDIARTMSSLKDQLEKKGIQLNDQKELVKDLKETLGKEVEIYKEFITLNPSANIQAFLKYYMTNEENAKVLDLTNYLEGAQAASQGFASALSVEKLDLDKRRSQLLTDINIATSRLNALKRNVKTYPRNVQQLIEAINTELSSYYKKEVKVHPLADLIEVNDESWRNALEGYLSGQRFDLIIDSLYFNDALEVYDRVKTELGIYGVGLVNTGKIGEYLTHQAKSLAAKVSTEHPYAKSYINMLIGNVICAENVGDLKNYNRAITKSCMTYSNHTARQINPKTYEVPYIGQQATLMQVNLDQSLVNELQHELNQVSELIDTNYKSLRLLNQSKLNHIVSTNMVRLFDIVKQTRKEYIELEEKLSQMTSNPKLAELENQLNDAKNKKRQLRMDFDKLSDKMADIRREKTSVLEQIDDAKSSLQEYLDERKTWTTKYPTLLQTAYQQFNALKERFNNNYDVITRDLSQSSVSINNQNAKAENEVVNLMRTYIISYHFGAAPEISELIHFEKEANLIRQNNLMKYEQDAIELRRQSEIGFREEFVGKLRASIEAAQIQIAELNMALEGKKFGTDAYRLITKQSDNPEFRAYYDIIMGSDAVFNHTLFTENLTKKNEVILMELFNKIASFDPENDKFALHFLDYRYYMGYDIEVTSENGNKALFSKVSHEKSGGETQVPYYIVIAASFQQLLSKNKRVDSGCIVLFDEAFNKMDESRIDAMMKFYNSLAIQLIIAVPPQRVSDIINYVNTSIAIVKDNDFAIVEAFNREGMN